MKAGGFWVLVAAVTAGALRGGAAEIEWNQKGTAWEEPGNWAGGRVPGPEDIAVFPASREAVKNPPSVQGTVRVGGIRLDKAAPATDKSVPGGNIADAPVSAEIAWKIAGAGKIVVGKDGISLSKGNAMIEPALELAADQVWQVGPATPPPLQDFAGYRTSMGFYAAAMVRHTKVFGYVCEANLILRGPLSGPGSPVKRGRGLVLYALDASPRLSGAMRIEEGIVAWQPTQAGEYTFGTRPLTLDGGSFWFEGRTPTVEGSVRLINPIRIGPMGGELQHSDGLKGATLQVGGPMELGGPARWLGWRASPRFTFDGPGITLAQRRPAAPGLIGGGTAGRLAVPVVDGPGVAGNPLILEYDSVLSVSSPRNDYAGPTVVSFMWENNAGLHCGVVYAAPDGRLGRGNLIVQPGGRVHLSAPGNLATQAEAQVEANALALGVLGVGYDGIPTLAGDSAGVLAVDCPKFDAVSDLSTLGGGRMYLGARDQGSFSGATLAPGKDRVYRLGGGGVGGIPGRGWPVGAGPLASGSQVDHYAADHWIWNPSIMDRRKSPGSIPGGGLLSIENGVLNGNADVEIGAMRHFGNGAVLLKRGQGFTGTLTVQGPTESSWLTAWIGRGSLLEGMAQTAAGQSPFGSTGGAVRLVNSTLKLTGVAGGQPVAKGELSFTGACTVGLDANTTNRADLTLATLARDGRSVLTLDPAQERLGTEEKLTVSSWKTDADLLPPYYLYSSTKRWCGTWDQGKYTLDPGMSSGPDFLAYDATGGKGFVRFTAYAADLEGATEKDVVRLDAGNAPSGSHRVRALKVTGNVTGPCRIAIAGGGLILGGNLAADIDFGDAEGVIYGHDLGPFGRGSVSMIRDLQGKVSGSNGITFLGGPLPFAFDWCVPGTLGVLLSNTANDFKGTVTIDGGSLYTVPDGETNGVFSAGSLGNLENDITLNGGSLSWKRSGVRGRACLAPSRTIRLGAGGGWFGVEGGRLFVHARITGPGALCQISESGTSLVITHPKNDYSGGTWISMQDDGGVETTVAPAGKLGTGPVLVGKDCALALQGDRNIDPHARLNVAYSGIAVFMSPAPLIGSLDGCGMVYLGAGSESGRPPAQGRDTILALGADNTDFTFWGTIRQVGEKPGDGIGSLLKTGRGVFTLHGGQTYTGATTVEQGTLDLRGGLAGDVAVKPEGTLKGTGQIAGSLTLEGGTLAVELSGPDVKPLNVAGAAKLGGKLEVRSTKGFTPSKGQIWTVLVADRGIAGRFDLVADGYQVRMANGSRNVEIEKP